MTSTPLWQAEGIDKSLPGVHAHDWVDFNLREVVVFDQWRRHRLLVHTAKPWISLK